MGSVRFPGKVLEPISGIPMLQYQIERARQSRLLDQVIVATTTLSADNDIANLCAKENIACYRGPEDDVLCRYYECAKKYNVKTVVRLTGDCPLIDPLVLDKVVLLFMKSKSDFSANTVPLKTSRWPDGSDVEVISITALERAHKEAKRPDEREHVTFFFWKRPSENRFKTKQLGNTNDWSRFRYTVDYPEDLEVVRQLTKELNLSGQFGYVDQIVGILIKNPEIRRLNSQYYSGIGWDKGRSNDL